MYDKATAGPWNHSTRYDKRSIGVARTHEFIGSLLYALATLESS